MYNRCIIGSFPVQQDPKWENQSLTGAQTQWIILLLLPFWQRTCRKPITHVGSGSNQAVGCWHLDIVLIRVYYNKAMRTNPGSNSTRSSLSLRRQGHLFKRKPKAGFLLSETKHEHWSSPQVAVISLVSTTGPSVTGMLVLCHSICHAWFWFFCFEFTVFGLCAPKAIASEQKVISIPRQTFCLCSGKSHLVVLWKSGLCCLSLLPVIDLSPGLSVVVTELVIMWLFKQLWHSPDR